MTERNTKTRHPRLAPKEGNDRNSRNDHLQNDTYKHHLLSEIKKWHELLRKECPDYESLLELASVFFATGYEQDKLIEDYKSIIDEYEIKLSLAGSVTGVLISNNVLAQEKYEGLKEFYAGVIPELRKMHRADQGRSGGQARGKKYELIKHKAYQIAKEKAPSSGRWPSRRQAVITIADEVVKLSKETNTPLSGDQALKTIDGWLKKMPGSDELFTSKRGTSTGTQSIQK